MQTSQPLPPPAEAPEGFRFYHAHRVRYAEVDAQAIVFNGHYMTFLDVTHTEYFRHLGLLFTPDRREEFDTALVRVTMEFRAPAMLDDILYIWTRVVRIGNSSFTQAYDIRKADFTQVLHAEAVYVNYSAAERRARPVPPGVRARIAAFEGRPL